MTCGVRRSDQLVPGLTSGRPGGREPAQRVGRLELRVMGRRQLRVRSSASSTADRIGDRREAGSEQTDPRSTHDDRCLYHAATSRQPVASADDAECRGCTCPRTPGHGRWRPTRAIANSDGRCRQDRRFDDASKSAGTSDSGRGFSDTERRVGTRWHARHNGHSVGIGAVSDRRLPSWPARLARSRPDDRLRASGPGVPDPLSLDLAEAIDTR